MRYTILVKNGTIFDGLGNPPHQGDIGIWGSTIRDVGKVGELENQANVVVDATNLIVSPGFIDVTNHSDTYGTLFSVPGQQSLLMQGITTVVTGNCGYSLAPLIRSGAIEDLGRWTDMASFNIDWSSVGEWYSTLDRLKIGVNIATLVGQETIRKNASTSEERVFLMKRAMSEGAWGLSSSISFIDFSSDAVRQEMLQLLKVVHEHDGVWKIHLSDEGQNLLPSVASVISLVKTSGVRTIISHFKAIGRKSWNEYGRALAMIDRAREQDKINISIDVFPYLRTGSLLVSLLPSWAREGDTATILARLKDPQVSQQILSDMQQSTLHPERIMIASAKREKAHVGKTLDAVSANIGLSPEASILEILKTNDLGVTIFGKTIHSKNLIRGVQWDDSMIASDGAGYDLALITSKDLAHPRSFGAFPRFFDRIGPAAGLAMERMIQKITSIPAQAMGMTNRGVIRAGAVADIAVFNPETFKDTATYRSPYQYAVGMHTVVIGGEIAVSNNEVQERRFGNMLKKI